MAAIASEAVKLSGTACTTQILRCLLLLRSVDFGQHADTLLDRMLLDIEFFEVNAGAHFTLSGSSSEDLVPKSRALCWV